MGPAGACFPPLALRQQPLSAEAARLFAPAREDAGPLLEQISTTEFVVSIS